MYIAHIVVIYVTAANGQSLFGKRIERGFVARRQGTESRLTTKRAEDLEQVLRVPGGSFAPSLDRSLVGGLSHQVEGEMADNGHVPGAMAGAEARLVLIEGDVEGPVQVVFDGPVASHGNGEGFGREGP